MTLVRKAVVKAEWDEEAQVWFVAESDVPGLSTEASTLQALVEKLHVMIPELMELNGEAHGDMEVPLELLAHYAGSIQHHAR